MALPNLPSLEDELKKELNTKQPSLEPKIAKAEAAELPKFSLPSLDDDISDSEEIEDSLPTIDNEDVSEEPIYDFRDPDLEDSEEDFEEALYEEGFSKIDTDEEDYDNLSDEDNLDDLLEETLKKVEEKESEEEYSFLPVVDSEDDEDDEEYFEEPSEPKSEKPKPNKARAANQKGFKELDDEGVKEFFDNLKSKFSKKGSPKIKNKPEKQTKQPKIKSPKKKVNGKGFLNKTTIIYSLILLLIIGGIIFGITKYNESFKSLDKILVNIESDDTLVELNEFNLVEGKINFTAKNNADISNDFLLNIEFKEKSLIPFIGKKFQCVSDIIALEPDMSTNQSLTCNEFEDGSKYKTNVDLVKLP